MPKEGEIVGTVAKSLGAAKFLVDCEDKNERVCSIPGRLKRRFWIKEKDVVLVKPWEAQPDKRGDILWRYSMMDKEKLRSKGFLH